jgi:hypothetical protein
VEESATGDSIADAEARLEELKGKVANMLHHERMSPDWQPEWVTEDQADLLYQRWLSHKIWDHFERPDVYPRVRSHDGNEIMRMLAYTAEKEVRLREILREICEIEERHPSLHTSPPGARWWETLEPYGRIGPPYGL